MKSVMSIGTLIGWPHLKYTTINALGKGIREIAKDSKG